MIDGYAAIEQYEQNATDVGPWADLYAPGMTAYRCISNIREDAIPDAVARAVLERKDEQHKDLAPAVEVGKGRYDKAMLGAVDWAIEVYDERRPRNVAVMKEALLEDPKPAAAPLSGSAARHAASEPRGFPGETRGEPPRAPRLVRDPETGEIVGEIVEKS